MPTFHSCMFYFKCLNVVFVFCSSCCFWALNTRKKACALKWWRKNKGRECFERFGMSLQQHQSFWIEIMKREKGPERDLGSSHHLSPSRWVLNGPHSPETLLYWSISTCCFHSLKTDRPYGSVLNTQKNIEILSILKRYETAPERKQNGFYSLSYFSCCQSLTF